jgi:hypothetical protein
MNLDKYQDTIYRAEMDCGPLSGGMKTDLLQDNHPEVNSDSARDIVRQLNEPMVAVRAALEADLRVCCHHCGETGEGPIGAMYMKRCRAIYYFYCGPCAAIENNHYTNSGRRVR